MRLALIAAASLPAQMALAQVAPPDPMAPLPEGKAEPLTAVPPAPVPAPPDRKSVV